MTAIFRVVPCALLLLASCDKPRETARPDNQPEPVERVPGPRMPRTDTPEHRPTAHAELEKAAAIPTETDRIAAIAELAWNHLETDPELAHKALDLLPADHPEKIALIQQVALRMAEENPDQAIAWADARSSESEISAAKGQIALVLAESDPRRAAELLSDSGIEGRDFDVAVVEVLERWASTSPPEAAAWVTQFPAGEFREAGIKSVISQWAGSDPSAATQWSQSLTDPAQRKEASTAMAEIIFEESEPLRSKLIALADPSTLELLRIIEQQVSLEPVPE